jgi:hypothetical protein
VRLAFLDVLRAEHAQSGAAAAGVQLLAPIASGLPPVGPAAGGSVVYMPPPQQGGAIGWLQRRSGVLGLVAVLLLAGLIGLLVGHWITASNGNSGPAIVKVEYPNGVPTATAPVGGSASTATPSGSSTTKSAAEKAKEKEAAEEAKEEKEIKAEEKHAKALPAPVKRNTTSQKKFEHTTGKQHAEEALKREKENPFAPESSG